MGGNSAVSVEFLHIELIQGLLRNAIAFIRPQDRLAGIMLTSAPHEQHSIGLSMAEAMLAVEAESCGLLEPKTRLPMS